MTTTTTTTDSILSQTQQLVATRYHNAFEAIRKAKADPATTQEELEELRETAKDADRAFRTELDKAWEDEDSAREEDEAYRQIYGHISKARHDLYERRSQVAKELIRILRAH